jgi:hypothetical protein
VFQLSFLNAGLLFFAAATVLPLLIWLLAKKKPRRIIFSSLRFIKLSQQHEKSRTKLTNILLLVIRMLIILLLALAIARPMLALAGSKDSDKHPPTALAIIVDTSYSMDYVEDRLSRLDLAKKAINTINNNATDDDRLIVVTRDAMWNAMHSQIFAKEIPEETLRSISIAYQAMDWEDTFSFAESRLSETQMPNREIYLLSDLINEKIDYKSDYPVALIPIGEKDPRQNISLSDARILPKIVERGKEQAIEFSITNHGSLDRSDILIQAVVNDIKVGERFVSVPARTSSKETISFELRTQGWQSGYIEVIDEYLSVDNRAYFAFEYYQHPRVAVIGDKALPSHLNSILKVFGGGNNPDHIDPASVNMQLLSSYQIFVFYEFIALSPRLSEFIKEMDARGIGSLFCPAPNMSTESKTWLSRRFSTSLSEFKRNTISIDHLSELHQASALIADKNLRFNQITAYWAASPGASTLISASGNALALEASNSALWLWDVGGDSPFFADPAFAVYAYRQLSVLMNADVPSIELKIGDNIRGQELILPNMERLELASAQYLATEPGVYIVNPDSPKAYRVAVNLQYQDSDPTIGSIPKSFKLLGENYKNQLFMARLGRDLWKTLLILALMLVIIEIIIIKYMESKSQL